MKREPVLVIMAAGMGSRYGGLKQMDPVDRQNHVIIDFSIFDAKRAGFKKVVFIIKHEIEKDFKEMVGNHIARYMDVEYVYQQLDNLPEGYSVPEGRVKPWGTGHAILSCMDTVKEPFAVINADDYYGVHAFQKIYDYLSQARDDEKYRYAMVGYILENTLTENGHVARGVCTCDEKGMLAGIHERTHIEKRGVETQYMEDDGKTWVTIPEGSTVSMNMWGFTPSILQELKKRFMEFLDTEAKKNPMKAEYFLPFVVDELIQEGKATAKVLKTSDRWYGVTYKEDKQMVMDAIQKMKDDGIYPDKLWK